MLENKRIAILATDGFEESELFEPKSILELAGAKVDIISIQKGSIKAWNKDNWGRSIEVDHQLRNVDAKNYDALVLPGGVMNPDKLRIDEDAIMFASHFASAGKPIAAICHGPWLLIELDILQGRQITSWPSLKSDLTNAGAYWVDSEVVVDNGLITSQKPADIPFFCKKLIEEILEGPKHPVKFKRLSQENAIMT